jgi:hypothetical protein
MTETQAIEEQAQFLRSEIRSMKGMLLSRRNFPSLKKQS